MKPTILISLLMALCCKVDAVEFQNLNFDAPNTNNLTATHYFPGQTPFPIGTVADLLPGWNIDLDHKPYSGPVEYLHGSVNVPNLFNANNKDAVLQQFFFSQRPPAKPVA